MPDPAIELAIHARFAQVSGLDIVTRQVEKASEKFKLDPRKFAELEKITERAAQRYHTIVAKARPIGMAKDIEAITDKYQALQQSLAADVEKVAKLEAQIKEATNADERALLKQKIKMAQAEANASAMRLEAEIKAVDEIVSRRTKALEEWAQLAGQSKSERVTGAVSMAEDFAKGLSQLDPSDLKGFAESFGKGLSKAGGMLEAAGGARMAAGAAGGQTLAGIGAGLASLAGPLAAVAAAVAALTALFFLADKQTKDFNKTLLQGAGAADFAVSKATGEMTNFIGSLKDAREVSIRQSIIWREQPEEIMKIIAAANEAGLTYQEMSDRLGDAGDNTLAFTRLTQQALVYSRTLGVSTEEIAQTTAAWMHDFGGGLDTINQGFGAIFTAAMESGVGAKRFFGMVTQATAGLALYNVRIDETAALMAKLAESLGETGGSEFLQGLTKGFTAESYQDRFKRILITGQPMVQKVLSANADSLIRTFGQRTIDAGKEVKSDVVQAFADVGIADFDQFIRGGPEAFKAIRSLSDAQTRELVAKVMDSDKSMGRQLQTMIGAVEGTSGKLGDQAKALDELGPGGVLAMQLNSASAVLGNRVSEMSGLQLAAFEQMTGYSGEQLHQLQRLDQALYGEWELAKKSGKELGSFEDYLMTQGDRIASEIGEPMSVQEQLAKQVVANTESITSVLKGTIAYLLENINSVLQGFRDASLGYNEADKQARDRAIEKMEEQRAALAEGISKSKAEIESGAVTDTSHLEAQEAAFAELSAKIQHFQKMDLARYDAETGISKVEQARYRNAAMYAGGTGFTPVKPTAVGPTTEDLENLTMSSAEFQNAQQKAFEEALVAEVTAPFQEGSEKAIKAQKEEFQTLQQRYPKLTEEGYLDALRKRDIQDAAGILAGAGTESFDPNAASRYMEMLASGTVLGPNLMAKLAERDPTLAARFGVKGPGMDDFIYRGGAGGGVITPINRADQLLGGKAGGPVAAALGGGGGVVININGGDTARIYEVVKRAMRESGVRPPPGGKKG